jgi:hypothetical protein
MTVTRRLRAALKMDATDRRELADRFYETKRQVYRDTLADLASGYGYDVPEDSLLLSEDIVRELRAESNDHARLMVETFNRDVDAFLDRQPEDMDTGQLLATFEDWAYDRAANRVEVTAITEAYSAYADATVSFAADAGIEPEYEFGGHPEEGDAPPECEICQALEATNPHPHSRVLEVGTPHPQCRQRWHPLIDPESLPDELNIGRTPGGLLGGEPLNMRTGGREEAVGEVQRLTGT